MIITTETWEMKEQFKILFIASIQCCQLLLIDAVRFDFADRAFKLGYLDKDAMLTMKLRLEQTEEGQNFKVSKSDIINLYTWIDLAAKSQLTPSGDETIASLSKRFDKQEVKKIFKIVLEIHSHILCQFNKTYKDNQEFKIKEEKID